MRWCAARGVAPGAALPAAQGWALAHAWYHDRMAPGWWRKPAAESQAVLASVGLSGPFWQLPRPAPNPND